MKNYITAAKKFVGNESVTYTTHSDPTFLENLIPLVERWRGPVSISIYCPGTDYDLALHAVNYYRNCGPGSDLVRDYVTFHFYFEVKHTTSASRLLSPDEASAFEVDCGRKPPGEGEVTTYRRKANLTYPVNVGRNLARTSATTHYVLPSDIELYPNTGLIKSFLKMVTSGKEKAIVSRPNPKVYVTSIFEIEKGHEAPRTKAGLLELMKDETVIPFHKRLCERCHKIPGAEKWMKDPYSEEVSTITAVGKRTYDFERWEPIYIGTHSEPLYDERLSWEGRQDKMTQVRK